MTLPKPEDYPKLIQVKDAVYHIIFTDSMDKKVLGLCDDRMKLILISLNQPPSEMLATIWHELMHAVEKEFKVNLGHPRIRKLEWAIAQLQAQVPFGPPKELRKKKRKR